MKLGEAGTKLVLTMKKDENPRFSSLFISRYRFEEKTYALLRIFVSLQPLVLKQFHVEV